MTENVLYCTGSLQSWSCRDCQALLKGPCSSDHDRACRCCTSTVSLLCWSRHRLEGIIQLFRTMHTITANVTCSTYILQTCVNRVYKCIHQVLPWQHMGQTLPWVGRYGFVPHIKLTGHVMQSCSCTCMPCIHMQLGGAVSHAQESKHVRKIELMKRTQLVVPVQQAGFLS